MAIFLFTDFGANGLYVGQLEAVLDRRAPGIRVIHLLHEAPRFDVKASAHLLAALALGVVRDSVIVGVVDPGVGSDRGAIVMSADGRWYVGPDNGLFSVVAARASGRTLWRIGVLPSGVSPSFHGRDVFAPMAAAIAIGAFPNDHVVPADDLAVRLDGGDLAEIIYLDHYGNAWTGLRAGHLPPGRALRAAGREIPHARVFAEVPPGTAFWYENSSGLAEIAVNRASAREALGLAVGDAVTWT
jgi:S-adenosylmethionine hydrolase